MRNPMYIGLWIFLAGAALFYQSVLVVEYVVLLMVATNFFVAFYEEPTLRRSFGEDYWRYCREVRRWRPQLPKSGEGS